MTSLVSGAEPGFEPIEGYILRERIGSGGYGEVWLADAPGGLQKAIKFVFGTVDERAGNELRALQRIRAVHHPFILSLERIEIVNNQLIVVTELADGSLLDRFQEFHQRGLVGIPRNRLLEYLRDTADALDFLCQKHDLQHLDVKPANLLLVADRVKVGDFGLIKDLQSKSMSVMSGMTPTYAAPEMFDGRPGRASDQYSLAIVYMELLTGKLPFNGRTTAQLATEHLHKAPNLDALPVAERPIISKALAKKPSQRFSSCREFVDALNQVQADCKAEAAEKKAPNEGQADPKSTRNLPRAAKSVPREEGNQTVTWEGMVASTDQREVVDLPVITFPSKASTALAPSLFIGVGGTGAEVLTSLRSRLQISGLDLNKLDDVAWIQADTDESTLQRASDPATSGRLSYDEILFMPLRKVQQYRERPQEAFTPLSRRWLYNVPRSRATEGVRPMGMLAFLDHAPACYQYLHSVISRLVDQQRKTNDEIKPIRIYFVGSAHGGTGSVLTIELAFIVRQILAELNATAQIQSVLSVGEQSDFASTELASASSVACLHEFSHFFRTSGLHPGIPGLPADHSSKPPWNFLYLVHGGQLGKTAAWRSAIEQLTDFLCIDACTALGEVLDEARDQTVATASQSDEHEWAPWLRMFSSRRLDISNQLRPEQLVKRIVLQSLQEWLGAFAFPDALREKQVDSARNDHQSIKQRLPNQQVEFFVNDLFREKHWTAQSWVRQCMEQFFPSSAQIEKSSTVEMSDDPVFKFDTNLAELEKLGLEAFSEALGISLKQSQLTARTLIDDAVRGLVEGLRTRWLQSMNGWNQLHEIFDAICQRFTSQSQSLKTVADRFVQQRETLLNSLYAEQNQNGPSELAESSQRELVQKMRSMEIQGSVHQIASKMLWRLGQHVTHLRQVWRDESTTAANEFRLWTHSLANDLEISIDADGRIRDTWMPIPANWFGVREATQKSIDQSLQSMIHQCFFAAMVPASTDCVSGSAADATAQPSPISRLTEARRFDDERLTRLLDLAIDVSQNAAIEGGLIAAPSEHVSGERPTAYALPKTAAVHLESKMLFDQLNIDELKLLSSGGAKRTFLLLPSGTSNAASIEEWKKSLNQSITIVELDGLKSAIICVDGEQLDLNQLVYRFWLPGRERCQLAERLHSRNDIEWLPMV